MKIKSLCFLKQPKGFTLIGVLVAATIGVIVVAGLSQMFANMAGQVKRMEDRSKRIFFNEFVGGVLRQGCNETLLDHSNAIAKGTGVASFYVIKNKNNQVALDLVNEKSRLESQYGIIGDNYFKLTCLGALSTGTNPTFDNDCDCQGDTAPCSKKWRLSLITQNKIKGVLVYERGISFDLDIRYPSQVASSLDANTKPALECDNTIVASGVSSPPGAQTCNMHSAMTPARQDCGTTKNMKEETVTAFGFNIKGSGVGKYNSFFGHEAGKETTVANNSFFGYWAGKDNTIGAQNTFVGTKAGEKNKASYNTFIGHNAGKTSGSTNISTEQQSGDQNTFVGAYAGEKNTTGRLNTFVGAYTGTANTSGNENVFIGFETGQLNESGGQNIFIGRQAGQKNTASNNIFIGRSTGNKNTTGTRNTFFGRSAGLNNLTGNDNVFIGYEAGEKSERGKENVFIGNRAGQKNENKNQHTIRGDQNVFIGYEAGLTNNTEGRNNIFIGHKAGRDSSSGWDNIFIGTNSGLKNRGENNIFMGYLTGNINTTGKANTIIGIRAGEFNKTGNYNTFVGITAGQNNSGGIENTFVGNRAGNKNTTGNNNLFMGHKAGHENTTGLNNIFIGSEAGYNKKTDSYKFILGRRNHKDWINGEIGTDTLTVNSKNVCLSDNGTATNCPTTFSGITLNDVTFSGRVSGTVTGTVTGFASTHTHPTTSSSRTLKKNIKPFNDIEGALEDIINTPLFTYEYKKDLPEKSRRGIISEELPKHLQIKEKAKVSRPDWPSIYGTLWAAIKALNKQFLTFKSTVLKKLFRIESDLNLWIKEFKQSQKELKETKLKLTKTNKKLKELNTKWHNSEQTLKKEIEKTNKALNSTKAELFKNQKDLQDTNNKLEKTNQELAQALKKLNKLEQKLDNKEK